jgi:signal transduction histidine kinase
MNERYNTKTLLFGMLIGTRDNPLFLFINTSVEPLDSTISILAEQMVYITVALLILGLLISFFMARSIARPIVKITKSAEVLAQGNYNITFDGKGYDEVEKLAATLNYASLKFPKSIICGATSLQTSRTI